MKVQSDCSLSEQSAANLCVCVCLCVYVVDWMGWAMCVVDLYWKKGRISLAGENTTLQEPGQPSPAVNPSP